MNLRIHLSFVLFNVICISLALSSYPTSVRSLLVLLHACMQLFSAPLALSSRFESVPGSVAHQGKSRFTTLTIASLRPGRHSSQHATGVRHKHQTILFRHLLAAILNHEPSSENQCLLASLKLETKEPAQTRLTRSPKPEDPPGTQYANTPKPKMLIPKSRKPEAPCPLPPAPCTQPQSPKTQHPRHPNYTAAKTPNVMP